MIDAIMVILVILIIKVGCSKLVIESSYNRLIAPPPLMIDAIMVILVILIL